MMRTRAEYIFVVVVLFFVAAVALWQPTSDVPTEGFAAEQIMKIKEEPDKPQIELLSPVRNGEDFNAVQTFLFRVEGVDYRSNCQVLVDDRQIGVKTLQPGQLGEVKTDLAPGYHEWSVECKLLNGRTISSQEWAFTVKTAGEMQQEYAQPDITGQAINAPEGSGSAGFFIALIFIGALIWSVNFARSQNN